MTGFLRRALPHRYQVSGDNRRGWLPVGKRHRLGTGGFVVGRRLTEEELRPYPLLQLRDEGWGGTENPTYILLNSHLVVTQSGAGADVPVTIGLRRTASTGRGWITERCEPRINCQTTR